MVRLHAMNLISWTARSTLLLAGFVVVASGCAGFARTEPRASWPNQPATAATPASPTLRSQGGWGSNETAPGSDRLWRKPMPVSDASNGGPNQKTETPVRQVAYQGAVAQPGGPLAPPPAPIWQGGSGAVPAPANGVGAAGTGVPNGSTGIDNDRWLTSPYLNQGGPGTLPPAPQLPGTPVPLEIVVEEARTGRFMFGAGINSDAGVTGQITIDERNFDIFGFPKSFSDLWNGTAFRGRGQGFRLEAMPGTLVQRYLMSFTEPYLFSTPISLNVSGFLYDRGFYDWRESRAGGRAGLGYRLTPDLSASAALRLEKVDIANPRVLGVEALDDVLGSNDFYSGRFTLRHDTRDLPFAPTEGHLIELSYEQAFGQFDYPRAEFDYRRYFLIRERPDGSGRHTLAVSLGAGFSGAQTPLFENYFAGGFSTIRGFRFREASPVEKTVRVGGQFRMLGSIEYMMPLTADDMIKAVAFCDYGTVEQEITIDADNFRVAPGFGFRISIPALGPAPLAFDFAFPVAMAETDRTQVFSFFFGIGRG